MPGYPPQIDGVDRWESGARYAGISFRVFGREAPTSLIQIPDPNY
jgi:hypothetical protein